MTTNEEHVCGTCKWHYMTELPDWVCVNDRSEYLADFTSFDDTCEEWEER